MASVKCAKAAQQVFSSVIRNRQDGQAIATLDYRQLIFGVELSELIQAHES